MRKKMPILPVEAYTSQAWFDREVERIFSRTWACAGFAEDLSEPGQYLSIQAGLNNIFVVMGADRRLRAFHNICRHRGTQLIRAVGKASALRCPYHDWTYNLEGKLTGVPKRAQEFPDFDPSSVSLFPASVGVWRGLIWVHPEPDALPLAEWFGALEPHLGPHRVEELVEVKRFRTDQVIEANWKIVVENYVDAYHLKYLHSGTLAMYDHERIESGWYGPHFAFWEPLTASYQAEVDKRSPLPLIDHVPRERLGAWVPMLFPGIGFGEAEGSWSLFHVTPLAPERTRVTTRTKVAPVPRWKLAFQLLRSGALWQRPRGKYPGNAKMDPLASGDFLREDTLVCEQQQRSLRSPWLRHGPSARNGELAVRRHQEIVLEWLGGDGGASTTLVARDMTSHNSTVAGDNA